ncbi:MAG: DUF3306 domain-containing protein [Hyphomicrobiaceae bacterium]
MSEHDSGPDDDGFIGRWSRRKAEVKDGLRRKEPEVVRGRMITEPLPVAVADEDVDAPDEPVVPAEPDTPPETDTAGDDDKIPSVEDLEGIDIDALGYDADFTRFMQPGVPDALRQRALRRLWRTNPILANVDGLNDYDEDFSDAALAVDAVKSAYKVGQGYLNDEEVAERDAERLGETAVADAPPNEDIEDDAGAGDDDVADDSTDTSEPAEVADDGKEQDPAVS